MPRSIVTPFLLTLAAAAFYLWSIAASADSLPRPLEQALHKAGIPSDAAAVWVRQVDKKQPELRHNADRPMNPASVMKLVTAFAALDALGPAHTWTTSISTDGSVRDGVLNGNLYITGSADPLLTQERLSKMFRQLRAIGVETVSGDIVLDDSILRLPPHDPYAFDQRGLRPYNSGPYGLLMHFNTVQLLLIPDTAAGRPVSVIANPPLTGIPIDNRILTTAGNCGIWYSRLEARLENQESSPRLVLSGSLPASCGTQSWGVSPFSPAQFSAAMTATEWQAAGGKLQGQVRHGSAPSKPSVLAGNTSPALAEIVREMNKWSSNVIARQLLAVLGLNYARTHNDTTVDMVTAGGAAATERLRLAGVGIEGLRIENGAGLSRSARIRADTLGEMLIAAWQRPFMPEFIAALPIAGIDGTARRQFGRGAVRGRAHIKTGTINQVRAIAGYLQDGEGRRYAIVMMVNHPNAAASVEAQNALLEWLEQRSQ